MKGAPISDRPYSSGHFNELSRLDASVWLNFLLLEVQTGLTLAKLAETIRCLEPRETEEFERIVMKAMRAYHTVLRFCQRVVLDEPAIIKLNAGIARLRKALKLLEQEV